MQVFNVAQSGGGESNSRFNVEMNSIQKFIVSDQTIVNPAGLGKVRAVHYSLKKLGSDNPDMSVVTTIKNNIAVSVSLRKNLGIAYTSIGVNRASVAGNFFGSYLSIGVTTDGLTMGYSSNGTGAEYSWSPGQNFYSLAVLPYIVFNPSLIPAIP
jgi:hypothetical protein